jgi:hypothetical protein
MEVNQLSDQAISQLLGKLNAEKERRQSLPAPQPYRQQLGPSYGEFIQIHGGEAWPPIPLRDQEGRELRTLLLYDGSTIEGAPGGFWATEQKPGLPRLEGAQRYLGLYLEGLAKDFNTLKLSLEGRLGGWKFPMDGRYGDPPADGVACLKRLRSLIGKARKALKEVEAKLAADPVYQAKRLEEAQRQAEMQRRSAMERMAREAQMQALSAITI